MRLFRLWFTECRGDNISLVIDAMTRADFAQVAGCNILIFSDAAGGFDDTDGFADRLKAPR